MPNFVFMIFVILSIPKKTCTFLSAFEKSGLSIRIMKNILPLDYSGQLLCAFAWRKIFFHLIILKISTCSLSYVHILCFCVTFRNRLHFSWTVKLFRKVTPSRGVQIRFEEVTSAILIAKSYRRFRTTTHATLASRYRFVLSSTPQMSNDHFNDGFR